MARAFRGRRERDQASVKLPFDSEGRSRFLFSPRTRSASLASCGPSWEGDRLRAKTCRVYSHSPNSTTLGFRNGSTGENLGQNRRSTGRCGASQTENPEVLLGIDFAQKNINQHRKSLGQSGSGDQCGHVLEELTLPDVAKGTNHNQK